MATLMVMSTDISQLMFMSTDSTTLVVISTNIGHLNGYINWY